MDATSTFTNPAPDVTIESATVTFNGQAFTNMGSFVSPDYLVCYPDNDGSIKTFDGQVIGRYQTISSRPAVFFGHWSVWGNRYYYMRATLSNGAQYAIRGFGAGMIAKGKRIKGK